MAAGQDGNRADDDAVWQDLVARLERADDGGGNGSGTGLGDGLGDGSGTGLGDGSGTGLGDGSGTGAGASDAGSAGSAPTSESVGEHSTHARPPAPREPSASERVRRIFDNQPRFPSHGPRDYRAPDEPVDEAYHPQDLPPLGGGEPLVVLSWLAAAGGPIALLVFSIFWQDAPRALTVGIIIAFLAGVTYLISRLPSHRDHSDGDGAAV